MHPYRLMAIYVTIRLTRNVIDVDTYARKLVGIIRKSCAEEAMYFRTKYTLNEAQLSKLANQRYALGVFVFQKRWQL